MSEYHLNCVSGLAGDMFLGACLDLGMPLSTLQEAVASLGLAGVSVDSHRAERGGIAGTRFRVLVDGQPLEGPEPEAGQGGPLALPGSSGMARGSRDLASIRSLIESSGLPPSARERSVGLLCRLGEVEAKIHAVPLERVHFHELGAVDSIVDLVGAAVAVEHLKPERVTCGPICVGGGVVETTHGTLPVPPPAAAELLKGIPIFGSADGELVTPTGAVLLAELVDEFVELPAMVLEGIGYGLGRRRIENRPNAVRLLKGRAARTAEEVLVVECEIDDLAGEGFGYLMERLFDGGALDVYFTPVQMKKNRPGTLVTLLCCRHQLEEIAALLLAESGSLGCRYHAVGRLEAERDVLEVQTRYGSLRVKRARLAGRSLTSAPEFEDCRRLAMEHGVPWREVYRAALAALSED